MAAEETGQTFTADDLAHVKSDDGAETDKGKTADNGVGGETGKAKEPAKAATEAKPGKGQEKTSIAAGGDTEGEDKDKEDADEKAVAAKVDPNQLSDELRQAIAEHYAAGDKKALKQELRRLERVRDIKSLWGMYRELEGKFTSGGLVKLPGKDAKPEEIAAFHKALGVPEKPEEYFKQVKLENGAVIGEADKPLVDGFAAAVHKSGATPEMVNAALNWYYANQGEQAAALDEGDDTFRREAEKALKDELGPAFKRKTNAIASLFATAPGGTDIKNENSLYARMMGGRMADGRIIGNDPDMVRFLVGLVSEVNPAATVVEDGKQSGMSIDT